MNIKDYIHYFIGQKCLYSSHHEPQNEPYILAADNLKEAIEFGDRPILRRVKSLTKPELLHVARLAFFNSPRYYPDSDYLIVTQKGTSSHVIRIDNDWYEKELRIDHNTCNLWLSWKSAETERVLNQPQIFHYLLSLGIDLFGLIEAGMAVDAATINQQNQQG